MPEEIKCPHCGNPIYDDDALLCHFCGGSLNRKSAGALGKLRHAGAKWLWLAVCFVVIAAFVLILLH